MSIRFAYVYVATLFVTGLTGISRAADTIRVEVRGGFETDRRDRGRPVVLVAAALGVPDQVFRDAFSHVRPAPAGQEPDRHQVDLNKQALLNALAKFGVTNERLDEVSNYYRYNPGRGEMWRSRPAKVSVTIDRGAVTKISIEDGGAGFSSPPTLTVPGYPKIKLSVKLSYGKKFDSNGSIQSVTALK